MSESFFVEDGVQCNQFLFFISESYCPTIIPLKPRQGALNQGNKVNKDQLLAVKLMNLQKDQYEQKQQFFTTVK
jgi:hypothetical protein